MGNQILAASNSGLGFSHNARARYGCTDQLPFIINVIAGGYHLFVRGKFVGLTRGVGGTVSLFKQLTPVLCRIYFAGPLAVY